MKPDAEKSQRGTLPATPTGMNREREIINLTLLIYKSTIYP
jgi:hypothetical protein